MELKPDDKLGPYEIVSVLGKGGMGEVWRAHDPRLGRDVAIKVSAQQFSDRFEREARAIAALNHSNICTLFDVGPNYLVMELVEGPTLAERIQEGPLPLEEALPIARQIADALEAAHEKNIVHRDLKPANIKIRPDGSVKVLDFGLAKAGEAQEVTPNSPTITLGTQLGMVLGTAGYMSPEQARGKEVDKRADIWAFGVVLYEMATGKRLFKGETVSDSLAAVLREEPDLAQVPEKIRRLLASCLEKDPKRRLRDIGDAGRLLDTEVSAAAPSPSRFGKAWSIMAAVATAVALALAWLYLREPPRMVWTGSLLGAGEVDASAPRISPDGTTLAFLTHEGPYMQIAVMKPLTGDRAVLTHNTINGYINTESWAFDGSRIFYDRATTGGTFTGIFSVPAVGGEERLVLKEAGQPVALPDGSLLVTRLNAARRLQLFRFWPDSGRLQPFPLVPRTAYASIRGLPGGHEAVAVGSRLESNAGPGAEPGDHFYVVNLDTATLRRLPLGSVQDSAITGFAPARDRKTIIAIADDGTAKSIVAIPVAGNGPVRLLFSLTRRAVGLDVGPDGSLYLDQDGGTTNILVFAPDGGGRETLAAFPSLNTYSSINLDSFGLLRDGSPVVDLPFRGKDRLMVLARGKAPAPLAATQDATAPPMTVVGAEEAAFLLGPEPRNTIAFVNVATGSITHQIRIDKGPISALAASPDGKVVYCAAGGVIWGIPVSGGEPKKVHAGDSVAVDPNGQFLIVQLLQAQVNRLIAVPLDGGPEREIPPGADLKPTQGLLPTSVSRDGRILTPLASPKDYWPAGITDIAGHYRQLPDDPARYLDFHAMAWAPDGRIVARANEYRGTLWQFRPQKETR
jgi:hypothetical protein